MKRFALLCFASCATFEDPTIVVDLRVIAMTATPPEQVIAGDASTTLADLQDKLEPTFVCAVVAEPGRAGPLHWSMTACLLDNGTCDPTLPSFAIGSGEMIDPESTPAPICAPIDPSPELIALLGASLSTDQLYGADGVPYSIELQVGATDADRANDQSGVKELRLRPRLPADRTPNQNPTLASLQLVHQTGLAENAVLAHCAEDVQFSRVQAGTNIDLTPVELPTTREAYSAGTIMGTFEPFVETITYQWLATAGSFEFDVTGGTHDFAGNEPGLTNGWIAPIVDHPSNVQLWVIQRDERGGDSVYPLCIEVVP